MATAKTAQPGFWKIGAHVSCPHPSGVRRTGRVSGNDKKSNGVWVSVNIAPKGSNPIEKYYRTQSLIAHEELDNGG